MFVVFCLFSQTWRTVVKQLVCTGYVCLADSISRIVVGGRRDRMVVGFTTTCEINAYHHWSCEFEPHSWQGVLDATLCDKICQWLVTGQWFSPVTPVSSTNKTDHHDITEILLKVALNTIIQLPLKQVWL